MKKTTIKFDENGKQLNILQYYSDKAGNWKQRIIETDYAKEKKQKEIKQLEFKLNDKKKEINLETEIINLNKLRRKESNKRRKNYEQKH